ncbi:hypothetical protein SAMN05192529_13129 [Arachidicoccus rhizosphaerae]|uniref:Uncharacterized protein n=1 Tax=Arachidicoccus rhizosphaerae TaxID=551991 RepID=A0A1H4CFP8_9BACT|nr:hypothetical protein [Arachidicoccus rhizosphaerae]SEA59178.1 hypothetical protein SAMN05192529_13129 [Arachidicoccus rhizosphaerae]
MNFQLKTTKETYNLAFNAFFIERVCQLSGLDLSEVFNYLIGNNISKDSVKGGLIQSMGVRANVIAAGIDAYNKTVSATTEKGYEILDSISLIDGQFSEMYGYLIKALLPNAEAAKPKKVVKAARKPALKK